MKEQSMNIKHTFPEFIMKCCQLKEWSLRKFLKRTLTKNGFSFTEDDYISKRANYNKGYESVHNLLFVRGNPKICLVAHTDVCRDHTYSREVPIVKPVIKTIETLYGSKQIIQDKDCEVQVGGDDRLGVAINTWTALNTDYDLGLLFTTDEEVGLISAGYCTLSGLKNFELLVQVDRGNNSNQLVSNISGIQLAEPKVIKRLLKIAKEMGVSRNEVRGLITDVAALRENEMCSNAVNMTCGYHNSHGSDPYEYIDILEAESTLKYVHNIIQYYDENKHLTEEDLQEISEKAPVDTLYL